MAAEAERSKTRPTATQSRAARRIRRTRRRRFLRWGGATAVGTIAFVFILSLFIPNLPLRSLVGTDAPDGPGLRMDDQGQAHVNQGVEHPSYNSIPATSGPHFAQPLAPARWGVHPQPLVDEVLIHNLEHGYVNMHYSCADEPCPELVGQLSTIVDEAVERGGKVLLSPYPDMETKIALTAWTFIETMEAFDEVRIRDFMVTHESSPNAPEFNVGR